MAGKQTLSSEELDEAKRQAAQLEDNADDEATATEAPINVETVISKIPILDQTVNFALPADDIRERSRHVLVRPTSGRVTVTDKDGKLLARFANQSKAAAHLKACKVDVKKLHQVNWKT